MMVDLDALLNATTLDVWGVDVTYSPIVSSPGRAAFAVKATWVREPVTVLTEMAASEMRASGHSTIAPMLGMRVADLGLDPAAGDRITVYGTVYEIWDPQVDTTGWAELIMREIV